MKNPILEKRIIPVTHPTDNQKAVLAKIVAAATPKLAAADISDTPNLAAARDMLAKMGLIELNAEGAFVTDAGNEVMVNQNLTTPDGSLTDDGNIAAHGKDAPPAQDSEFDFGMGGEDDFGGEVVDGEAEFGDEEDPDKLQNPAGDVGLDLDIGEKFSLLIDLRDRVIIEGLENVPEDLLRELTPTERRQLERIIDGQEELLQYKEIYSKLYSYFVSDMPYGVAKARTGDPDEWIMDRIRGDHTQGPGDDIDAAEYQLSDH